MIDFEKNSSYNKEKVIKNFESIKRILLDTGVLAGRSFGDYVRMLSMESKPNKYVFVDAEGKTYHD